jgi:hypothetical protein
MKMINDIFCQYHEDSMYFLRDHLYWVEFHPDFGEEIPEDLSPQKITNVQDNAF